MRVLQTIFFDLTYGRRNHFCVSVLQRRSIPLGHIASKILSLGSWSLPALSIYLAILEALECD